MSSRSLSLVFISFLALASVRSNGATSPSPTSPTGQPSPALAQTLGSSLSPTATVESPAKSPLASPLPTGSATPPDALASDIEAGEIFLRKNDFNDASEAFSRALKSTNTETRRAALAGLEQLEEKRSDRFRWFLSLVGKCIATLIKGIFWASLLLLLWFLSGLIGRHRGRNRIRISGFKGDESEEAALFRMALFAAIAERNQALGPLSDRPTTPWILFSVPEIFDLLPEVLEGSAAKIFAMLLKRTIIPEFDARVWSSGKRKEILVISLFRRNTFCRIWREYAAREKDNFLANVRAAHEMIAYLVGG